MLLRRGSAEIEVDEYEVRYIAAPWTGQKTGAFLDQRENRRLAGEIAHGIALDCFSYHGSFALHLARNADQVTALDSSAQALDRARQNAALNGIQNIDFVETNAFDFLKEKEQDDARFDTIVLDPPAFAKTRSSVPAALRGYKDINMRAMRLLARRWGPVHRELQFSSAQGDVPGDARGRGGGQRATDH